MPSVDVQAEVEIARPRAEVAAVMFDPKSHKLWITGLRQVNPMATGPVVGGGRIEWVGEFMGRPVNSFIVVTRAEDGSFAEFSLEEPFELKLRHELRDAEGGTLARIRLQSIGDVDLAVPSPVLARQLTDKLTEDLKKLKRHCEGA